MRIVKGLLVVVAWGVAASLASAQSTPSPELTKEGEVYVHAASKSRFAPPKNWEALKPTVSGGCAYLTLRHPPLGLTASLSWTPLNTKMEEALDLEVNQLGIIYGKEKVVKKDPITVENKPVYVIEVDDGTLRDGKESGVVYLFEGGPDERHRWKIKVRATWPKKNAAEAAKMVEELLTNFQW